MFKNNAQIIKNIQVVILNACNSDKESLAEYLSNLGIQHVVTISDKIFDGAAIKFSQTFFNSLFGSNRLTVCDAFAAATKSLQKD